MRIAITHFDGDPFVLDFWLYLYQRFWRGEVDTVMADVCYDPQLVPDSVIESQKISCGRFPEIEVKWIPNCQVPEQSNVELIKKVKKGFLVLVESDCWIFGKGIIKQYFKYIEEDSHDIVCGNYRLWPENVDNILGYAGFMRNLFFARKKLFEIIDLDFFPRCSPDGLSLDCFGWISYQLARMKPRVLYIPNNFVVDNQNPGEFIQNKWLHIRQMNSSILGFGNCGIYRGFATGDEKKIAKVKKEVIGSEPAEWQYYKAIAMRLLMLGVLPEKKELEEYRKNYLETIKLVMVQLGLDQGKIAKFKAFYRAVMEV